MTAHASNSVVGLKLQKRLLERQLEEVEAKFRIHKRRMDKRQLRQRPELPHLQPPAGPSGRGRPAPPRAHELLRNPLPVRLRPLLDPSPVTLNQRGLTLLKRNSELRTRQQLRRKHVRPKLPKILVGTGAPAKTRAFKPRTKLAPSLFPRAYQRGELPCKVLFKASGNSIEWTTPLAELQFDKYLPIFFDGMRELEAPYQFLAREGVREIMLFLRSRPEVAVRCVPRLVGPMRTNLSTRVPSIVITTLQCCQDLLKVHPNVGKALVPFYPQVLSMFNLFSTWRQNIGDAMVGAAADIGDLVRDTLELMERTGGKDADLKIKHMVPCYESCMRIEKAAPPPPDPEELQRAVTPYEDNRSSVNFR